MAKKSEKEKAAKAREATLSGALLAAALCIFLGLLYGGYSLAITPVTEVREFPAEDEIEPNTVYFVQPSERGGSGYKAREAALLSNKAGTIQLTEGELNTWSRNNFKFGAPKKPGEEEESGYIEIKPSAPKFRIDKGGTLNMSMNIEVTAFGLSEKMLLQSEGTFNNNSGVWAFSPSRTYIGSAPVPNAGLAPQLLSRVYKLFENTETFKELYPAWNNLSQVKVTDNTLILLKR